MGSIWKFAGKTAFLAATAAIIISGCATMKTAEQGIYTSALYAEGARTRSYKAQTQIYSRSPEPAVAERKFRGDVEINVKGGVRSYKFSNDFGADPKANTVVTVALSGASAGFSVFSGAGAKLVEQTNGKSSGGAALFDTRSKDSYSQVKWYFGPSSVSSVIEAYGQDGKLVYSEVTSYTLQ